MSRYAKLADIHPLNTLLILFVSTMCIIQAFGFSCDGEPEDEEGSAVLCDYLCLSDDDGQQSKCEWTCEDPELEVACNFCEYKIESGNAKFTCTHCDVGTY